MLILLCSLGGVSLVRGRDPDVRHSQGHGVGGLEVDGLQRLHDAGIELVPHLGQLLLPELVGELLTNGDAVAVRRLGTEAENM